MSGWVFVILPIVFYGGLYFLYEVISKRNKRLHFVYKLERELSEKKIYLCSHANLKDSCEVAIHNRGFYFYLYQSKNNSVSIFEGNYRKHSFPISILEIISGLEERWGQYSYSTEHKAALEKMIIEERESKNPKPKSTSSTTPPKAPTPEPPRFDGCVYCLSNPAMPGLLKIGYTTNSPHYRAEQLFKDGGTGVPAPYQVEFYYQCMSPFNVEQEIHRALAGKRYQYNREFFQLSVNEAYEVFKKYVPEPRKRFA